MPIPFASFGEYIRDIAKTKINNISNLKYDVIIILFFIMQKNAPHKIKKILILDGKIGSAGIDITKKNNKVFIKKDFLLSVFILILPIISSSLFIFFN